MGLGLVTGLALLTKTTAVFLLAGAVAWFLWKTTRRDRGPELTRTSPGLRGIELASLSPVPGMFTTRPAPCDSPSTLRVLTSSPRVSRSSSRSGTASSSFWLISLAGRWLAVLGILVFCAVGCTLARLGRRIERLCRGPDLHAPLSPHDRRKPDRRHGGLDGSPSLRYPVLAASLAGCRGRARWTDCPAGGEPGIRASHARGRGAGGERFDIGRRAGARTGRADALERDEADRSAGQPPWRLVPGERGQYRNLECVQNWIDQ